VTCIPMSRIYLLRQLIFHIGFYWLLIKNRYKPDIIMFGQMTALWMLPVRLVRLVTNQKRPLLVIDIRTIHMDDPQKQGLKGLIRGWYQEFIGKYASFWVDGYLTITKRMAEFLRIREDQLWGTWPSGVDLDLFKQAQNLHNWPDGNTPIRLIYIGALHYERNLINLCKAVEQANHEGLVIELWLIGSGNGSIDLAKFATNTNGRIRVYPPVKHEEIPKFLAQAHIGVLPFTDEMKFQVSSPIKLFEYLAAGLPILATRLNCHTDVVGDRNFVFWSNNASPAGLLDAIRDAWRNRGRLAEMSLSAIAIAPEWTWRESAIKLKKSLESGLDRYPE
jgi:glycosyltransferase involved in cell wall biosynthesis